MDKYIIISIRYKYKIQIKIIPGSDKHTENITRKTKHRFLKKQNTGS